MYKAIFCFIFIYVKKTSLGGFILYIISQTPQTGHHVPSNLRGCLKTIVN